MGEVPKFNRAAQDYRAPSPIHFTKDPLAAINEKRPFWNSTDSIVSPVRESSDSQSIPNPFPTQRKYPDVTELMELRGSGLAPFPANNETKPVAGDELSDLRNISNNLFGALKS